MSMKDAFTSQHLAALAMLTEALRACPETLWNDPAYPNRFWHVGYHTLFYTDLYLHPSEADFKPWTHHRDGYQNLGPSPEPPHEPPDLGHPYGQAELLDFAGELAAGVAARVVTLDLTAESGFSWLPFNKFELQIYNIRHLQHHTGQLIDRLRSAAGSGSDWIGRRSP